MGNFVQQTPITHKIEKLSAQWLKATENPEVKMVRWYALQEEQRMVQGFLELECSEHGNLNDIFIRFNSPFLNLEHYTHSLLSELITKYKEEEELVAELENEGSATPWNPDLSESKFVTFTYSYFFNHLTRFLSCFPEFQGNMVLYFTPEEIENYEDWEEWVNGALRHGIPDRIIISVVDCNLYNWFNNVARRFPLTVKSIRPDLKMIEAMKQMAVGDNKNDPDAQFRYFFLQMTEAAAQKKTALMEDWAERGIECVRKNNWPHLEALILLSLGSNYLQLGKVENSIESYNKGLHLAQTGFDDGRAESGPLVIQCLVAKGSALNIKSKIKESAICYAAAGNFAKETGDYYQAMEAFRMAGKVFEDYSGSMEEALGYYENALICSEKISEETRMNSTFLLLADDYKILASAYFETDRYNLLLQKLNDLGGDGWENKVENIKMEFTHAGSQAI